MKKGQTSKDVYNKDADQTVLPHNLMPVVIQPGMFYSFWRAILDYKTSYCLLSFSAALLSGDKWELTQIFDLINCR